MIGRRIAAVGALIAVLAAGIATAVLSTGKGSASASDDGPKATTKIVRKDLVETETVDGTLGYSDARTVVNHLHGTVTWLPAAGRVIRPGHRLFQVNAKAVYLLDGTFPAYRTLKPGESGTDVHQLERNLRDLGFDDGKAMKVDQKWTDATTRAVERWQRHAGMTADGSIELGRVVFQPGARRVGERTLSQGGDAGSAGAGAASGSTTRTTGASASAADIGQTEFVDYTPTTTTPTTPPATTTTPPATTTTPSPSPTTTSPGATTTPCTCQQTPQSSSSAGSARPSATQPSTAAAAPSAASSPAASPSASAGSATAGAAGGAASSGQAVSTQVMTTTTTKRVVTVDLLTSKLRLAKLGATARVEMPAGNSVTGRITDVGKVATAETKSDGSKGDTTLPLTITLSHQKGTGLDQAPVSVDLESSRAKDVLTIPVTALLAQSGGRYAVEVHEGTRRRLVAVTPGLYTDDDVEITGPGLSAGMIVTDSRV